MKYHTPTQTTPALCLRLEFLHFDTDITLCECKWVWWVVAWCVCVERRVSDTKRTGERQKKRTDKKKGGENRQQKKESGATKRIGRGRGDEKIGRGRGENPPFRLLGKLG